MWPSLKQPKLSQTDFYLTNTVKGDPNTEKVQKNAIYRDKTKPVKSLE